MQNIVKIAGLNLDIQWKDKVINFNVIERQLENISANIFLLPEMFATGFCMDAEGIADQKNETLSWMQSFAEKRNTAVAGSVSIKENGKFYNRFYFVKPDKTFEFYDKRHLFAYSGEDKIYTKGNERVIVNYFGVRFLLQVCYDLRFPVFSRNNDDYDVALYVANWPDSRVDAWNHLLKARALENQAYVFGLNRIGRDGYNLNYTESSHCFFADGSEVLERRDNVILTEINLEKLKIFREKFRFLDDRDDFEINL